MPPSVSSPEERLALYREVLPNGPRRLFLELENYFPHPISRDKLAARAGLAAGGGAFGSYLGTLRQNDLVEDARGILRLNGRLFGS